MSPRNFLPATLASFLGLVASPAATVYVAPGGAGNGSSPSSPLGSVNAAYWAANAGDIIEMASGTYANQPKITQRVAADSWTANVTVRPAAGATVQMSGTSTWEIYGSHMTFDSLNVSMRIKFMRTKGNYGRIENCTFYTLAGGASVTVAADHVQIVNNLFSGSPGDSDAIVVASGNAVPCTDVLIEGNIIRDYLYRAGGLHEDGIQLYDCNNVVIRNNVIANTGNSCIIFSPGNSTGVDNVLIENNFLNKVTTNNSATLDLSYANATNVTVVNNTINGSLRASTNASNTIRNNIISWLSSKNSGEKFNYIAQWNSSIGVVPDATSRTGPLPAFVNTAEHDLHIASSNTVDLAFASQADAPPTDIDGDERDFPVWVGADQPAAEPPLAAFISYDDFAYAVTTSVGSAADSLSDSGWIGATWSGANDIVSPGLSRAGYSSTANALQVNSGVSSQRSVDPAVMLSPFAVTGTDGVKRIGAAGSTIWIAFLIRPDTGDSGGSRTATLNLLGAASGGGTKLSVGDTGTLANWTLAKSSTVASSSSPITVSQTDLLVLRIKFVSGSGNDEVDLFVNPPLGPTEPATPSASLRGTDIGAFDRVEFKGTRLTTFDELALSETWRDAVGQ